MKRMQALKQGFTVVELLVVIAVIALLATIVIVSYAGIQEKAAGKVLTSDLNTALKQLTIDQGRNGGYPATLAAGNKGKGIVASPGTTYTYTYNNATNPQTLCLSATNGSQVYSVTQNTEPAPGGCTNLALNKTAPGTILVDGVLTTSPYYSGGTGLQSVTVDLQSVQNVSVVKVWHYWGDGRTYNATKTEVSKDNTNWTTVFDSASEGTYAENATGHTVMFDTKQVRYIRDWVNGSSVNISAHWVEIQAF
ncbi:MAG TPA: discoidin domain-containing protein [Candidatus Saccharimonadales bacterium]